MKLDEREIPFAKIDIREEDLTSVKEVLLSGWLTHGKYTKKLEDGFSDLTSVANSISVSNATAGLHLSVLSTGVGAGDQVIVPAMTHTATAHAVEYTGASAVFADVDPVSGNITAEHIDKVRTDSTRGVIVVHMAGLSCDMAPIIELCEKHDLFLIEDCAHALGTTYNGDHVGGFGVSGCFSFYPTKQIGIGEGGMVISRSAEKASYIRTMKAFGINTPPDKRDVPGVYDVIGLGYNFRMTDYQAALAYCQLNRYSESLEKRRRNARNYDEILAELKGEVIDYPPYDPSHSYFLYQILLNESLDRTKLVKHFGESKIGVSIHYATPVPLMSYYAQKYSTQESDFPNALAYGRRNISLPIHPGIDSDDISRISECLKMFCNR